MKQLIRFTAGLLLSAVVASCATPTSAPPPATMRQATATIQHVAEEADGAVPTQELVPFPLSEPGPYYAGKRQYKHAFEDADRDNRTVGITVWYPAVPPEGSGGTKSQVGSELDPDRSGAPYPLLLSSTKMASRFAPYLISHGFAWASVDGIDTWGLWDSELIEQPLDILFALDQVASDPPEGLEGMIDADRVGVLGYSFDGYNALALSGARVDPQYHIPKCAESDTTAEELFSILPRAYWCAQFLEWDQFAAHASEAMTASDDGLWQPMTDARIRAVMPLAGEGWMLFGDKGLAAVDRPILMIVASEDEYYPENVLIFEHLGTPDKSLVSFVGEYHDMVFDREMVARMAHFAVAFFGYHLQGREDLAWYFSEEFVAQHDDLAWGVYEGE